MQVSAEDGRLQPNRFFFLALPEGVLQTCTDSEQTRVCLLLAFQTEGQLQFQVRGTGILDRAVFLCWAPKRFIFLHSQAGKHVQYLKEGSTSNEMPNV